MTPGPGSIHRHLGTARFPPPGFLRTGPNPPWDVPSCAPPAAPCPALRTELYRREAVPPRSAGLSPVSQLLIRTDLRSAVTPGRLSILLSLRSIPSPVARAGLTDHTTANSENHAGGGGGVDGRRDPRRLPPPAKPLFHFPSNTIC